MSRALDTDTISSFLDGHAEKVYADVSQALCFDTETLLEIEFLGKSHSLPPATNVLIDGNNIAVSKARLVQAFVVAQKILFRYLNDCPRDEEMDCRNASAILLLMDPEHLTAANFRKRLIQHHFQTGSEDDVKNMLKKELMFVNSYLTSRLHRHTKSPTLWAHRRWILELASTHLKVDVLKDLRSIVLVAAERHPKNYYAWSHMRWLIRRYAGSSETSSFNDLPMIITETKNWCLRHPNDTSGFSFLLFGLRYQSATLVDSDLSDMCSAVCTDVLHLAVSFKWTHESVWVFLRTLVTQYGKENDRLAFDAAINDISIGHFKGQTVLIRAREWCARYQNHST